jgi:lysophospholipase L1-like esterase
MPRSFPRALLGLPVALALVLAACAEDPEPPVETDSPAPMPTVTATPAATPAAPTPEVTATPSSPADGVYLALGDSVTFGIGAPLPSQQGYPALLLERFRRAESSVADALVFAVPGETAAGFLDNRLDEVETAIDELGERIELVTIGLGANEILRIRRHPACEADRGSVECQQIARQAGVEAEEALDEVVRRVAAALEAAGSDAEIILLAYYNPDPDPAVAATIVGDDGVVACVPDDPNPGLNDRIACIADARSAGLVDLYAPFVGREEELTRIGEGDVHPNQDGYRVIADVIAEAIGLPGEPG